MTAIASALDAEVEPISARARLEADLLLAWSRSIADHRLTWDEWFVVVLASRSHPHHLSARIVEATR